MNRLPVFPTNEAFITHTRAVLAMLLRGDTCDQFTYHQNTSLPIADFRTRVSELYRAGWPIDREFHLALDTNGEPRRCKHYWLNRGEMTVYFAANSAFKIRCEAFEQKYGGQPMPSQLKKSPVVAATTDEASFQTEHLNDSPTASLLTSHRLACMEAAAKSAR